MNGLVPMTLGSWDYYHHEVARGAEDYFLAPGEEQGRWIGSGSAALGLAGSVEEGQLARLFDEGRHPVSGQALGVPYRHGAGRTVVTGFALSFSPPKSVSLVWGLGDPQTSAQVRAAHDAAVEGALSLLETHAAFSRRGRGGALQVDTEGYVGVAFTHRTSRSEDPQLHSHVLVANKVRGEDERWRSLDGRELFAFQKPSGMAYQAALRAELTNRLGVEWTPVDANGQAEVRGVPEELIEAFSQRRAQVERRGHERIAALEARLGRALTSGERAEEYQRATYDTRPRKGQARATADLVGQWRGEAEHRQLTPATWLPETLGRWQRVAQVLPEPDPTLAAAVVAELAACRSTWGRAEVLKALFPRLPVTPADAGAVVALGEETAASC